MVTSYILGSGPLNRSCRFVHGGTLPTKVVTLIVFKLSVKVCCLFGFGATRWVGRGVAQVATFLVLGTTVQFFCVRVPGNDGSLCWVCGNCGGRGGTYWGGQFCTGGEPEESGQSTFNVYGLLLSGQFKLLFLFRLAGKWRGLFGQGFSSCFFWLLSEWKIYGKHHSWETVVRRVCPGRPRSQWGVRVRVRIERGRGYIT